MAPLNSATKESELGERAVLQAMGVPPILYIMTILGIIKATVHWQKVGYSRVLHNLGFIDDC